MSPLGALEMVSSLAERTKMFSQVMCISLLGQEREAVGKTVQSSYGNAIPSFVYIL